MRVLAAVVLATTVAAGQTGGPQRTLPVKPGQELVLRLRAGGNVRITGSDQDVVRVNVVVRGRSQDPTRVDVRHVASGVEISTDRMRSGGARQSSVDIDLDVSVPFRFNVVLDSTGGSFEARSIDGTMTGQTMGGPLRLSELSGRVRLSTLGGDIRVERSDLEGHVSTNGGDVTFDDVGGGITGSSLGGNVEYRSQRRTSTSGTSGSSATDGNGRPPSPASLAATSTAGAREIRITTRAGNIDVPVAAAGATVATDGGNVHIGEAAEFVDARTLGGDVTVDAVDGWIEASTNGGNITATMVGDAGRGDRHVRLVSGGGDILLTVPESLGMRLDIEVAYARNSRQDYEIRSDFPLQIRRTTEWEYSNGDRRRRIVGAGVVGDGRHVVRIEAVNGDVIVRKAP